jgi:hypothetical protein
MDNIFFDISPFLSHCKFAAKGIEGYVSRNRFNTNYTNPVEALIEFSEYLKGKPMWSSDELWTKISNSQGNQLTNFSYKDERTLLSELIQHKRVDLVKEIVMITPSSFYFGSPNRKK